MKIVLMTIKVALQYSQGVLPLPKEAGTTTCGCGAPRRLCVNYLRNGARYAVFRWLTICFAIGKGDSLYGTNTLRKTADKRAYATED